MKGCRNIRIPYVTKVLQLWYMPVVKIFMAFLVKRNLK